MTSVDTFGRRWVAGSAVVAFLLTFLQVPGYIAADTKYDLTQNPLGFLERASHLWSSQAPLGQVQNQAYGYFFPHGAFFLAGDLLSIPPWITQRVWWALLLLAGFWGVVKLAELLGIGSRSSRVIAGLAFALSPRVLTTLASISSETLPMMLAPWVVLGVARFAPVSSKCRSSDSYYSQARSAPRSALISAVAVALMGAVNAVATAAAVLVAVIWWACAYRDSSRRRWLEFTAWWIPCLLLATLWWIVPLLILGRVSPPFLDYIESAGTTTQWTSLTEVLRGTGSWTPFVSPERVAGAVLVTQPAAVIATGVVAAAGMIGLCMRSMPFRRRFVLILFVGLVGLGAGYVGGMGSPFAGAVRSFLDAGGAPLRNVHKLEPLIRLPLVLGLAHMLGRVPLPGSVPRRRWRDAIAHPEREPLVAVAGLILVALTLSTSLAWTAKLAPQGAYTAVPDDWHEAADWLTEHAGSGAEAQRALVVPGAPFGIQIWGLTRDEPLQALATTPWAVRDSVPLTPPGAIRALDSVQRLFADGQPSDGLADTLLGQGISYLVVRNDLDAENSRSTRPVQVHQSIDGSPGLTKVAQFGDTIQPGNVQGIVVDGDLRPAYPAIEIYRVQSFTQQPASGPYSVSLNQVPIVKGGPESLLRLNEDRTRGMLNPVPSGPVLLDGDARAAGLSGGKVTITDTPIDRETDFGQVDNHSSAIRTPGDPRRTQNRVTDYPVYNSGLVEGEWSGARITVSSSASDATQIGGTAPGSGPAAVVDGDAATSWESSGLDSAVGQWLRLDFDHPVVGGLLRLRTSLASIGKPVKGLDISTPNGSTAARIDTPGEVMNISLPSGPTPWVKITAAYTDDGSRGSQFGIAELAVDDYTNPDSPVTIPIVHRTALPTVSADTQVSAWELGQELPGRPGCVDAADRVRCSNGLALAPEELNQFSRTLSVPMGTAVIPDLTLRTRQSPELEALLSQPGRPTTQGAADVGDIRGSAYALTDGNPLTSWVAPQKTSEVGGPKPTVTISLPFPTLVTGLDIANSIGKLPARVTSVAVNLGNGPQVEELTGIDRTKIFDAKDALDPGTSRISLQPFVTSQITLSLVSWEPVLDKAGFGFVQTQPAGLAEVQVLSGDTVVGGPVFDNRVISVGCDAGPVITIAGQAVHTAVVATAAQLAANEPVSATLCEGTNLVGPDSANPVPLPAGSQDVTVDPGSAFFVDGLRLRTTPTFATPAQSPVPQTLSTTEWTSDQRRVSIGASRSAQLLVVPESNNVGWVATSPDGTALQPIVVNGWQQGWIVPAGVSGTVALDFPTDRWYRLGIFGGLALMVLGFAAVWRFAPVSRKCRPDDSYHSRAPKAPLLLVFIASIIISGVTGAVVTAVGFGLVLALRRWKGPDVVARTVAVTAGLALVLSVGMLSKGPWRDPDGYIGHSWVVQLPALIAVVAVGLSTILPDRSAPQEPLGVPENR